MIAHSELSSAALHKMIRQKLVNFGGNKSLKIYGILNCASGKRMKKANRIFFATESEALQNGYRPCGNCMRQAYQQRKHGAIKK